MSDDEVSRLIDEVDENRDGKLDYKEVIIHQNLILFFRNVFHFILGQIMLDRGVKILFW